MYRYPIKPNQVRTWKKIYALGATVTVTVWDTFAVVGLDWHVHNRGASAITVRLEDGEYVKTIPAGEGFGINNTLFNKITVTSTVNFDLTLAGVAVKERKKDADNTHTTSS